jgi:hypothetical protein
VCVRVCADLCTQTHTPAHHRHVLTSLLFSDSTCRLVAVTRAQPDRDAEAQPGDDHDPGGGLATDDAPRAGSPLWFFKAVGEEAQATTAATSGSGSGSGSGGGGGGGAAGGGSGGGGAGASAGRAGAGSFSDMRGRAGSTAACCMLHLYSVYGAHLGSVEVSVPITSVALTANGEFLLCGDAEGLITVRSVGDLAVVHTFRPRGATAAPMRCLAMADSDRMLFCGVEGAPLYAVTDPTNTAKALNARLKEGLFGLG